MSFLPAQMSFGDLRRVYRPSFSQRVITILPCAFSPESCTAHRVGRNQPQWAKKENASILTNWLEFIPSILATGKNRQCHLLSLPVELLQEIATYLPEYERIALALTCKALQATLGSDSFPSLQKIDKNEFISLLTALQRDIPNYRVCCPCKTLHGPNNSAVALPPNKLRRLSQPDPLLKCAAACLLAPFHGLSPDRRLLYWLSHEHVQRAINKRICLSTLRCSGSNSPFSDVPGLHDATFDFKIVPVLSRRNIIFHASYDVRFACTPSRWWSEGYVKSLVQYFDLRCCMHCSTDQMLDEIICFLYHGRTSTQQESNACVRAREPQNVPVDEGCGHHIHACECATEYKIEALKEPGQGQHAPIGVRIYVWQWLGHRSDDYVLRHRGVLRNLYEDAVLELEWNAD
ncbi:hypothetical protein K469DRAFT_705515 [Zopfia rhizophila CBS 207.26]|uniref:F-box domain-containing protein n=1 Tax=Zopfia rhizophila CBS 207.26 TaxID=1314779 RepID=A0A6A6E8R0_9PEZI|nr:hypothetical protein K469DRAFT_705515 [Zopfia rhizophila CBS 207.26]